MNCYTQPKKKPKKKPFDLEPKVKKELQTKFKGIDNLPNLSTQEKTELKKELTIKTKVFEKMKTHQKKQKKKRKK